MVLGVEAVVCAVVVVVKDVEANMSREQALRLIRYWKGLGYNESWHVIREVRAALGGR